MTGRMLSCALLLLLLITPALAEETEAPVLAAVLTEPAVLRTLPTVEAPAAAELPEGTALSITALGSAFCTAVWAQDGAPVTGYVALDSLRFDVAEGGAKPALPWWMHPPRTSTMAG